MPKLRAPHTKSFYSKTYNHPYSVHYIFLGISEAIAIDIYKLYFSFGLSTSEIQKVYFNVNINLDRWKLRRYFIACKKWLIIKEKKLKRAQRMNSEWLKIEMNKGKLPFLSRTRFDKSK